MEIERIFQIDIIDSRNGINVKKKLVILTRSLNFTDTIEFRFSYVFFIKIMKGKERLRSPCLF